MRLIRHQLTRFIIVGITGTLVYYTTLLFFIEFSSLSVLTASSVGFVIVAAQNYFLHYLWTFRSTEQHIKSSFRFLIMFALGFFLNAAIMYVGTNYTIISYPFLQGFAILIIVSWNFVLSTFWVYGKTTSLKHLTGA